MNLMRKSPIHVAVAAALAGIASTSVAQPEIIPHTNTGQALIFPYYTVNNGWITTLNVMNTSDKTLAVKVRFHERKNSRDVLDFNIVMSPYDVWTGWLKDSDLGPQLFTNDNSCTSPLVVNGVNASGCAYGGGLPSQQAECEGFADGGGKGFNRMRDGYVEMLVMGQADTITTPPAEFDGTGTQLYVPYHAEHVDGVPRDCSIVDQAFIATAPVWTEGTDPATVSGDTTIANALPGSGDPVARADFVRPVDNPLKGNVSWLQVGTGAGAGGTAIGISNWAQENLVTAQQFPWFLEPTFATAATLWTVDQTQLDGFESVIAASTTFNEWANNPNSGAATDWVVTFPTKAYHVDKFNEQIQAAVSRYRNALADVVTTTSTAVPPATCETDRTLCVDAGTPTTVAPFEYLFDVQGNGDSVITVQYDVFDREEGGVTVVSDGTSISPSPPPEVRVDALPFEANVIQFAEGSVLGSPNPAIVDAAGLLDNGAVNGWASITFQNAAIPVTAFAVKARDQGEPSSAYGQAMENGYAK
jgi:hypothetical protein